MLCYDMSEEDSYSLVRGLLMEKRNHELDRHGRFLAVTNSLRTMEADELIQKKKRKKNCDELIQNKKKKRNLKNCDRNIASSS